jgi:predicted Zn finger-like uncharacterized protein
MDVRCERCKTEYEFDESRITPSGLAVQCTTCGHVFKVKKKALVVTLPVSPEELNSLPVLPPPTGDRHHEWRLRRTNGDLYTFKELTTLQKWIVERKVTRDDELCGTGESWRRLGSIAELTSFFRVVDEAKRAAANLEVLKSNGAFTPEGPVLTTPAVYPPPDARGQTTAIIPPRADVNPHPSSPLDPSSSPTVIIEDQSLQETATESSPIQEQPSPVRPYAQPAFIPPEPGDQLRVEDMRLSEEMTELRRRNPSQWAMLIFFLVAIALGAYLGYRYLISVPQQARDAAAAEVARTEEEQRARAKAQADAEAKAARENEAKQKSGEPTQQGEPNSARAVLAGASDAGVTAANGSSDAGRVALANVEERSRTRAEPDSVRRTARAEAVRNFDWYMSQAKKLRDRRRSTAALDAYAKAAEMRPDRAEPLAGKGYSFLDLGEHASAEASFQEALKVNPSYGAALIGLAQTYQADQRKDKALEYYEKYLEALPDGPDASTARGAVQKLRQR